MCLSQVNRLLTRLGFCNNLKFIKSVKKNFQSISKKLVIINDQNFFVHVILACG